MTAGAGGYAPAVPSSSPLARTDPAPLAEPGAEDPAAVSTTFPSGQYVASLAQLLVAAVEVKLARDPSDMFAVRRVVHELATHLDRLAPDGSRVRVVVAAAPGDLSVRLAAPVPESAGTLDSWVLAEARARFDEVDVTRRGRRLGIRLRRTWTSAAPD
jgi:hypothetical protein